MPIHSYEAWRGSGAAASRALYRALQRCVGSRQLWQDALSRLAPSLSARDRAELAALAVSSRTRVHAPPPPSLLRAPGAESGK